MNLYGFATGTNDYSLNLSERDSLRVGDIVTVAFLNGNTGASTLSVNGNAPLPLLRNESAMSSGDLVALTLYQFCFTGAAFKQDVQASAGATTDASLLTSGTLAEARLPNNINATRVADGSISNTEFQYLNNVSSNIQGQLDALTTAISGEASTRAAADSGLTSSIAGKADTSHTHSGTDIVTGTVPVAAIPTAIPAASIANGTVDNTEFQTLNGVTSNIQNQLDNKAALSHSHAASDITSGTIATARLGSGTADSTTFLCGDQTYKTVSATDNTKIPLAGTGSITGPLGWSSNSGNGTSSATWVGKDANGLIVNVSGAGNGGAIQVFSGNSLVMALNETYGISFSANQTGSGGPTYQIYRTSGHLNINAPINGDVCLQCNATTQMAVSELGMTVLPGSAIKSPGTSHAGDATYRNQYSLGAGTHYGFLFVTDELGSATIFTINGTTITLYANLGANVWSAGGATDRKARISAGAVQVQCGATFGAGYVSTFFLGTVR